MYQFTCFPNGLALILCPRKFIKLLKPVYSTLRMKGHLSVSYIDDSYLQDAEFAHCVFLGFVLDSIVMRLYLTPEKARHVKNACQRVLLSPCSLIREVAQVLGLLTSSFPGIMYGPLHYRWTEMDKTRGILTNL